MGAPEMPTAWESRQLVLDFLLPASLRLALRRRQLGLTAHQAAARSGLSTVSVSASERAWSGAARKVPPLPSVLALARGLGLRPSLEFYDILTGEVWAAGLTGGASASALERSHRMQRQLDADRRDLWAAVEECRKALPQVGREAREAVEGLLSRASRYSTYTPQQALAWEDWSKADGH